MHTILREKPQYQLENNTKDTLLTFSPEQETDYRDAKQAAVFWDFVKQKQRKQGEHIRGLLHQQSLGPWLPAANLQGSAMSLYTSVKNVYIIYGGSTSMLSLAQSCLWVDRAKLGIKEAITSVPHYIIANVLYILQVGDGLSSELLHSAPHRLHKCKGMSY